MLPDSWVEGREVDKAGSTDCSSAVTVITGIASFRDSGFNTGVFIHRACGMHCAVQQIKVTLAANENTSLEMRSVTRMLNLLGADLRLGQTGAPFRCEQDHRATKLELHT